MASRIFGFSSDNCSQCHRGSPQNGPDVSDKKVLAIANGEVKLGGLAWRAGSRLPGPPVQRAFNAVFQDWDEDDLASMFSRGGRPESVWRCAGWGVARAGDFRPSHD